MKQIYEPAEDSFLIAEYLSNIIPKILNKNPEVSFLEIGSGSGINLETAFNAGIKKEKIFSCDLNKDAVKYCKNLGFNCIYSNLFAKIPKMKFDIIIFNPPYLPEDKNYSEPEDSKLATTAGEKGNEIIIKFLKQAKNFTEKSGIIIIITSSLSKKIDFKNLGYNSKKISTKNLFFEKLFLWELKLANN